MKLSLPSRRAWIYGAVLFFLAAVCGILGFLQYRWIGEVANAEINGCVKACSVNSTSYGAISIRKLRRRQVTTAKSPRAPWMCMSRGSARSSIIRKAQGAYRPSAAKDTSSLRNARKAKLQTLQNGNFFNARGEFGTGGKCEISSV